MSELAIVPSSANHATFFTFTLDDQQRQTTSLAMPFSSTRALLRCHSSQNLHIGTIVWEKRDLRAHKLIDYASRNSDLINQ